ncbi:hypothetical protein K0M31_010005 [Melipona bicolor]|uniref:Uncharacterized protein n=1 Tax=Melipona bicolor TaxID=60889 RepID=A0AA40FM21_9HYME|nr:hypothetical protein K0M31_010005 [Melipona bicolor]
MYFSQSRKSSSVYFKASCEGNGEEAARKRRKRKTPRAKRVREEKGREGSFLFPMNKGVPVGDGFRVAVGVKSKGENRARGGARRSRKSGGL